MIHIIIPVHNGWAETRKCLASLQHQTLKDFTIYVVDDGSTDGTADGIGKEFPDVFVVPGDGNLWWTGAMRVGVEFVLKRANLDRDYVMALNNDLELRTDVLSQLQDFATAHPKSIVNALSVDAGDRETIVSSGNRIISWMLNISLHPFHGKAYSTVDKDPVEVDMLNGRSVFFPAAVFAQCGNFDSERFPHYAGDSEFTLRAKRNGWKLFMLPSAVVYLNQQTTGLNPSGRILSIREILQSFVSIKSGSNLIIRTRFALRCCPWYAVPSYVVIMYIKIFGLTLVGNAYVYFSRKGAS